MVLKSLHLQDFRNYPKKEFKFSSGTTLVVGPNTSGKTNLLEAIYLLATGKSFRAGVEREMIEYEEEIARVSGVISDRRMESQKAQKLSAFSDQDSVPSVMGGASDKKTLSPESTELEIILTTGQVGGERVAKKKCLVNGVSRRMMDFVGHLRCVLFGPEDLEIVINSPSIRRGYLDGVLEQVDRDYRRASLSYQKGLRQRNKLLEQIREEGKPRSILFFWNKLLVENGEIITQKREVFIDFVNQQPEHFGKLKLSYDKSVISPQRLEKYAEAEVAAGMTLVGPHRDDFVVSLINADSNAEKRGKAGRNLHVYGSRGEQRTAVFSLKLAELEFVAEKTQGRPVLLLDDILSELDQEHRARIFAVIPKQQTVITTTDLNLVEKKQRKKVELVSL